MSNVPIDIDRSSRGASTGEAVLYYGIFGVLFTLSVVRQAFTRSRSENTDNNIWIEAKRSAHATAGYAFKY